MTTALQDTEYVNDASQAGNSSGPPRVLDPLALLGKWKNTNPNTAGITEIWISLEEGEFTVRCFGAKAPGFYDWGKKTAVTYALSANSNIAAGFELSYQFGHQDALVTAIHNRGVLVIHTYHRFEEGSARSNFIVKEFFHQ